MQDQKSLQEEINQYKREKESIRNMLGQIGGAGNDRKEKVVNISFAVFVILLFSFDLMRHALHIHTDFMPEMFSIEIAVLLVSMKIIWMIHRQQKVEHFQFWILNTIEFQLNTTAAKIRKMEKIMEELKEKSSS